MTYLATTGMAIEPRLEPTEVPRHARRKGGIYSAFPDDAPDRDPRAALLSLYAHADMESAMNLDEIKLGQTLVVAMVSAARSMPNQMQFSAMINFQSTIEFLIMLGLVDRLADEGLQPPAELVELLRDELTQEGFPTNPSKRAVCLTYTVVLQAVIAWENAGELIDGVHYPTHGSSEWLPFIARAAIVNVDVAMPRVLALKKS